MSVPIRIHPSLINPNAVSGLVLALALSLVFAGIFLPPNFISGKSEFWLAQNQDITTYQAGFNAYFREPWHWPLLKIDSINWPTGTLATFVDIIPFYSALLKLLIPLDWFPFNPFGIWILICIVLQAIGGWWVLREAQVKSWVCLIALTTLLLSCPGWLNRLGHHTSLFSHWILLFAFALVLQEQRKQYFPRWNWLMLLVTTFFINLYLFSMISLMFGLRWLLQFTRPHRLKHLGYLALVLSIFAIIILATMLPLPPNTGTIESGFGFYSMNALSPFSGGSFFQITPDATSPEQRFEGLNYLGAGVFFLFFCLALIHAYGPLKTGAPKTTDSSTAAVFPASLWWLLLAYFLYALSNQIYWGDHLIFQWNVPEWAKAITGQFRVSGRFFWPITYGLMIMVVIATHRRYSRTTSCFLLCAACAFQLIDLKPQFEKALKQINRPDAPIINLLEWREKIPLDTLNLFVYPKIKCNKNSSFLDSQLPFMLLASRYQLNINTGYIARYNPICFEEAKEIAKSNYSKSAYIFVNSEYTDSEIKSLFPKNVGVQCKKITSFTMCSANP